MNANATGSRSDVTVILLGHEQADHRERAHYFYRQAAVPCLALELSQGQRNGTSCHEHLSQALQQITTPLVALALDADFVLPDSLDKAANHLLVRSEAIGAQGYALGYVAGNGQLAYYKVGSALSGPAQGEARARVERYAEAAQQAWRAVLRVSALQSALRLLPESIDASSWRVALSYALLAQGVIDSLEQTDVVCEYLVDTVSQTQREAQVAEAVRGLRQWDADHTRLCTDDFGLLSGFVRNTYALVDLPLLFTSPWTSVIDDPKRVFEPDQFVEMPYYNATVFKALTEMEFLCHAWPTGRQHCEALEGSWVRQRELLQQYPNDTPESLQQRYWQALSLGLFNREVCRRLADSFVPESNVHAVSELENWLGRLAAVPAPSLEQGLASTPSGQILAMLDQGAEIDAARQQVLAQLAESPAPQVAFVVVDLGDDDLALQATFDSVLATGIRDFKLLVLKAGKAPVITTARDTLHFIQVGADNWIAHLNQALRQLPSEWLLMLQAGEQLLASGVLHLLVELSRSPGCHAICANEVQRDEQGRLHDVVRPGADLDLLRGQPGLMSRHWLMRRQSVLDLGGYSESWDQALELDVLLRLVQAQGLGSLAHLDDYLVLGEHAPGELTTQALEVLERHLGQLGYRSQIADHGTSGLHIDFRHGTMPLISILVATENLASVQACLTSVLQRTRYPRYEVLVACIDEQAGDDVSAGQISNRVRLIRSAPGVSRGDLLNLAASQAEGEYLVLLSHRCEVINPAWLEGLLNEAQRPEIGVVGGGVFGQDANLLHAGYQLLDGPQVHSPWLKAGQHWQHAVRGCAAVSGDCLMLGRALFEHCGGLKSSPGADIELCLQAHEAGQGVVWTPQAQVRTLHFSPPDAGVALSLSERWPQAFSGRAHDQLPSAHTLLAWLSAG